MRRVWKVFLRLYPEDYLAWFGPGMRAAFEHAAEEHLQQGRAVFARFAIAELSGLMLGAAAEWIAKLTTDSSVRGRCLPDLRKMRPVGVPREIWFARCSPDTSR